MKKKLLALLLTMALFCTLLPQLAMASFAADDAPNTAADAKKISVNTSYSDFISDGYDVDYYSFTLSSAGTVSITFQRPNIGETSEYWIAWIYDKSLNEISKYSFAGNSASTTTYLIGVPAGTFYIRFTGGDWNGASRAYNVSNETYTFKLNYKATEYCEKENNETVATATKTSTGVDYTGSINDGYDVDYYSFTLSSAGTVSITFQRPNIGETSEYWIAWIYDESLNEISKYSFAGNSASTTTYLIGVPAGTFYIRFTGGDWNGASRAYNVSNETYTFKLNYKATEYCEKELNERPSAATTLKLESTYVASINDAYDIDYYKFTVSRDSEVMISISHSPISSSSDYWTVYLYSNSQSEIFKKELVAGSADWRRTISLSAGTYYVQVTGGDWNGANRSYRFTTDPYNIKVHCHSYTTTVVKPTCTAEGYTLHSCACGYSYKDTYTNALGHNYSYKVTTTPTTSASGVLTGTCSRCPATTTVTMPKLNTTDYTYAVTKAATCTATGTGRYTWKTTTYGTFYFDVTIAKTAHNYKDTVTAPTCTEKGYTTHTCSGCGDSYKDTYTDALGHDWDDGVVTTKPTETTEGVKTFTCVRCGATRTESVPTLDHTHNYTAVVTAPTCTEKGYTTYTCACGDNYITDYVGALGHNFVNGVCTRCGEKDPDYDPSGDPCEGYTDINGDSWYHSAADFVIARGIMGSTRTDALTFEPGAACTRGMIVSILYRLSGKPEVNFEATFQDVKEGQWFADAVIWANQNGIVKGFGNGKFGPNDKITREQMAVILKGYATYKGIDTDKIADLSDFSDVNKVTWSKPAVRWAVAEGLISGKTQNGKLYLDPQGNATRAEVAAILMRFIRNILEA